MLPEVCCEGMLSGKKSSATQQNVEIVQATNFLGHAHMMHAMLGPPTSTALLASAGMIHDCMQAHSELLHAALGFGRQKCVYIALKG